MPDLLQRGWEALASSPSLTAILAFGWLAYLVGLGIWIVLQKREPVATISWLVSLAALPYLGFLIYYVFGPQKIKRHRARRRRHHADFDDDSEFSRNPEVGELAALAERSSRVHATTASRAKLLVDGSEKFSALLEDVAKARDHVHVEYYIYDPDECGKALRDALVERARAGVKVRVLLDAVGSGKSSRRFFLPLTEAGGELAWFHPTRIWRFWRRPWLNLRNHRKIVVIDGRVGYTGGINVTEDQDDRIRGDAYRDLHMRVEGDVVRSLQTVFVEDWAYATKSRDFIGGVANAMPEPRRGDIAVQALVSGPDSDWETIHRVHVGAIYAASRRIWLMTPYFVPGEAAMMALTSAALAGLDVRLIVPRMSDSKLVTYCVRSYFDELLAAGVKVYEYGPRMLHSKALLVDDSIAIIGTANFDHRSFRLNFEVSMLFDDAGVAGALERQIEAEFRHAPRVRHERDRSLLRARLPEALARLASPLL